MKKLLTLFAALCCTVMMQAEIVHHEQCDPTYTTVGYAQECWEDTGTGKLYAEESCTTELNRAVVATYAKLRSNPIINTSIAEVKDYVTFETYESREYDEHPFYHGMEVKYVMEQYQYAQASTYTADFKVYGTDVANARIKWYRNDTENEKYGHYDITISVNGKSVHTRTSWYQSGFADFPLKGLKHNDIVTVKVEGPHYPYWVGEVVVAACLEYTSSNGGKNQNKDLTATQAPNSTTDYYTTFYSDESAYNLPDNAQAYAGKVEDNIVRLSNVGNIIPKGVPVILKLTPENVSESQYPFTLHPTSADATYEGENDLKGNGENTSTPPANSYGLVVTDEILGFCRIRNEMAANSAYLKFDQAPGIGIFWIADLGPNVVYHPQCEPTHQTIGYAQKCWEDTSTGKFYADGLCTQELNPAQVITYAKLLSNPIIDNWAFSTYESEKYEGCQFDWGVKMGYVVKDYTTKTPIDYIATFKVYGTDVANARIKFYRNVSEHAEYGNYNLEVKVNDEPVYTLTDTYKTGLFSIPINDIKTGDIITFKITAPLRQPGWICDLTMTACLEYTSSNGGKNQYKDITAIQDPNYKADYYATFYSDESAYNVPDNAKAYAGNVVGNIVQLSNIGNIIPKGEPVILKITPGNVSESEYSFALAPTSADAVYEGENDLKGNGENTLEAGTNTYCLGVEDNVLGYYPFDGTIAANSAYLKFDEATGIGMYRIAEKASNLVYHPQCDPTMEQYGYAQNCWEDTNTGKFYEDYSCTQELHPARLLTYAKLLSNPIIDNTRDHFNYFEDGEFDGCQVNWGVYTKYNAPTGGLGPTLDWHTADFMVYGSDVANARFIWYRNVSEYSQYGTYDLNISVNGQSVYALQDSYKSGLHCIALPDLKTGDIVRFQYDAPKNEVKWTGDVIMRACLQYTSSNGGLDTRKTVTAHQDPDNQEDYYATFYTEERAYNVPDNAKAYTGNVVGNIVQLSDIGNIIPKGEPVILKLTLENISESQYQFTLNPNYGDFTYEGSNDLIGNGESTLEAGANTYCLGIEDNVLGYYPFSGEIAANSAYLKFDEATGIGMYRIAEKVPNLVYHPQCDPTMEQYGYAQNCWEDTNTGKFYGDYSCTQELHPARLLTYAKLLSNPIINSRDYKLKDYESSTYESNEFDGCQFNWGVSVGYSATTSSHPPFESYTADFMVLGTDVANARFIWYRNVTEYSEYGTYDLDISVNGQSVYALQDSYKSGLHCIALPGLKTGDIVRFQYDAPKNVVKWAGYVMMTACLQYTSSNGGLDTRKTVTAHQDPDNQEDYYATFYSNEIAYSVPDNAKAYTAQVDGEELLLSNIGNTIHKGEAVILKATGNRIELIPSANKEEASLLNDLTGTEKDTTLVSGQYALSLGHNGVGFYHWEGQPIAANKAYLTLTDSSIKALAFKFEEDSTTAINSVNVNENENENENLYNLTGVRVGKDYKGIVIKNGKKVIR